MTQHGTFIWNELVTEDLDRSGPFYSEVFGWERTESDAGPLGTYTVFHRSGRDTAGMMKPTARDYAGSPPPRWVGYIAVDDADAITAAVERLGGRILEPPHHIPDVGRLRCLQTRAGPSSTSCNQPRPANRGSHAHPAAEWKGLPDPCGAIHRCDRALARHRPNRPHSKCHGLCSVGERGGGRESPDQRSALAACADR